MWSKYYVAQITEKLFPSTEKRTELLYSISTDTI